MEHDQLKDDVMAMADGELSPGRRAVVDSHLTACAECRALLSAAREAAALLSVRPAETSDRFVWSVMSRIRRDEAARHAGFRTIIQRWFAPVLAAAACAGFVAVITTAPDPVPATDAVLVSEAQEQLPSSWLVSSEASVPAADLAPDVEEI